jgi:hypothetical protein
MKFWPHLDILQRFVFFAVAPPFIVYLTTLFPVRGAIVDVTIALTIFVFGERARNFAERARFTQWLFEEALAFEAYYRIYNPRPFLYYLFYPLFFPYWLLVRRARHEFLVFRGYTVGGLLILLTTLVWQYFTRFLPELGLKEFLPQLGVNLLVETILALTLLMPIATTFVQYHGHGQRRRLYVLLLVGVCSSIGAVAYVTTRRDPVVSFATSQRVQLRTAADRTRAHRALLAAVRAARLSLLKTKGVDGDGKVQGEPVAAARAALQSYYKSDEALAFDVWASPRRRPRAIVLYFERRNKLRPIWVAVDGYGDEIKSPNRLPWGAFQAMRRASDGIADLLEPWPDAIGDAR